MKMWRKWLSIAVLLPWPAAVLAQTIQQDGSRLDPGRRGSGQATLIGGINRADTTMGIITTDASGNLMITDALPPYANRATSASAVDDTVGTGSNVGAAALLSVQWAAESTSVIPCADYRFFAMGLRQIQTAGDTTESRYAVQVRAHTSASYDTSSAMVWHRWPVAGATTTGGATDSLGHVTLNVGNTAAGFSGLYSGEFEVVLSAKRGKFGTSQTFGGPDGVWLVLTGVRGEQFIAPYMSVRVRRLSGPAGGRIRLDLFMGS